MRDESKSTDNGWAHYPPEVWCDSRHEARIGGRWGYYADNHYGAPRCFDLLTQIEDMLDSNIHPIRVRHTMLAEFDLLFGIAGFRRMELFGDSMPLRPFTGGPESDYAIVAEAVEVLWGRNGPLDQFA